MTTDDSADTAHIRSQEDRHVVINFTSASGADITLCGIFDGHCGDQASEFCVTNLFRVFNSCLEVQSTLVNVVKATFTQLDHEFCTIAKENGWESGTTGIIVVMHGDKLICGNVGDCRAVVGRGESGGEESWGARRSNYICSPTSLSFPSLFPGSSQQFMISPLKINGPTSQ